MAAKKQVTSASWSKDPINYFSITSLDGRNYHKISQLSNYFSEFSINKSRVWVEIEYLIFLAEIGIVPKLKTDEIGNLRSFYKNFSEKDMIEIKKIETQTNHDVKAVEYYIKDRLKKTGLLSHVEMVHWALTSEDVNNIAINSNLQAYILKEQLPIISKVIGSLVALIKKSDQLMLARTHGQPAGVTLLSKELSFYLDRILEEYLVLKNLKIKGKVSGVVGTFADQNFSYPSKKWIDLSGKFIERLGLAPSIVNTQILPYDSMISVFNSITRLQNISLDLVKNLWHYVSLGYFVQAKKEGEVGSSILPHKVNPIYLEGAEGGFELSSAIFEFYGRKLSQSRMQRDLSDSTIRRSMGVAFGYSYLSWQSVVEAVERIHPDQKTMFEELKNHWEIVTGPVQNLLRKKKYARPYEMFSEKVRGKTLTQKQFVSLIDSLDIKHQDKTYLKNVSLNDLVGESENIVNYTLKKAEKVLKDKNSIVVVGLQWGDEGKGKFIDYLGSDFPITVRYNGGNNAGHTVKSGKKVFHFSLIPSSVFHKKEAYISQAVVIDPKILIDEINQLKKLGIKPKLGIDFRCHIVLPYHGALDSASEWYKKGEKTGSLKLGIGFTYEDRTNRAGLRMEDLVDPERVRTVVNRNWDLKKKRVTKAYGTTFPLKKEEVIKDYTKFGKILSPYVADVTKIISEKILLFPEALELVEKRQAEGTGELGYEQQNTLEYLKTFSEITPKKARELEKELSGAGLGEKQAALVCNLLPKREDLLKQVLSADKTGEISEDNIKEILKIVKKY